MKNNLYPVRSFIKLLIVSSIIILNRCSIPVEEPRWKTGEWNEDSLGYHRIVIKVDTKSDAVQVDIPWRRRDKNPGEKGVVLIDEQSGKRINNLFPVEIEQEHGRFVFQPLSGPGNYYMYYLPGKMRKRSNYPKVNYPAPEYIADSSWIRKNNLTDPGKLGLLPEAVVPEIQSRDSFNSFFPMEVVATENEVKLISEKYPESSFLLFSEDRQNSIRMTDNIPQKWIVDGPNRKLSGRSMRGEYYCFQVGLYAHKQAIEEVSVVFSDFTSRSGKVIIPANMITSFNTGGTGWDSKLFNKVVSVPEGKVQALWCGLMIPEDFKGDKVAGKVTVKPKGMKPQSLDVEIYVDKKIIRNHGDDEPWRMTRLRWLNSTLAVDDSVVPPFTPVIRRGNKLTIIGREITIGNDGLIDGYRTFFNSQNTSIGDKPNEILSSPVTFNVTLPDGHKVNWQPAGTSFTKSLSGKSEWKSSMTWQGVKAEVTGFLEFDGFCSITIKVIASKDITVDNISLDIPYTSNYSEYFMGLGSRGGFRPPSVNWKWDIMKHQEGAWIGNVNGGIQFTLRDNKYERPLNTNFYRDKPLIMPEAWYNSGKGGIKTRELNGTIMVSCYSGERGLIRGDTLDFQVNFLFTPFKPIFPDKQWATRFFHSFKPVDTIAAYGANTINIHHANAVNPWINYPFLSQDIMKKYIEDAHTRGFKVKIYNTVRELSNHAPEVFAIRSFGHEIFGPGPGNGFNWLQEHLGEDYIPAWFVPDLKDAAIVNSGMSRWHNYYIEGMEWLTREMKIDGLYLDDVAFDRTTMKRLRKVLDKNREGALIDLHSANQYNVRDGFTNSANLYMEHFPYLDRLWFGEYFDRNLSPDFWLVEMSGIPFGLMGEMLQDGGNQYRGLIYGMTSRAPWSGDPRNIWKLWDDFGLNGADFIGYWAKDCPVATGDEMIKATVYRKQGSTLIALASWAGEKRSLSLTIDWKSLGLDPLNTVIRVPEIEGFQRKVDNIRNPVNINIEPEKGLVLILEQKK